MVKIYDEDKPVLDYVAISHLLNADHTVMVVTKI